MKYLVVFALVVSSVLADVVSLVSTLQDHVKAALTSMFSRDQDLSFPQKPDPRDLESMDFTKGSGLCAGPSCWIGDGFCDDQTNTEGIKAEPLCRWCRSTSIPFFSQNATSTEATAATTTLKIGTSTVRTVSASGLVALTPPPPPLQVSILVAELLTKSYAFVT